jgi:hypothetical protein
MSERRASTPSGFQGAVGNLPLVDLLQVWAMNRLSGLVTVGSQGRTGRLYLAEGEVVHAEAGDLSGEAAVRVILAWPDGTFELAPNTTALARTIHKGLSHLLLDAHRLIDEGQRDRTVQGARVPPGPEAPSPAALAAREPPRPGLLDQLRALRGVTSVVRFARDGRPVGEAGPDAEALAAKGLYLEMAHAASIASAFGLHDLAIATVQGAAESFVVVHGTTSSLCVAVDRAAPVEAVVSQLRAILTRPVAR